MNELLWHGTSGKIAERILREGIIPNGTESLTLQVSEAGTLGGKRVDPTLVYLMDTFALAIPFGWCRVAGRIERGRLCFDKHEQSDHVAVFGIEPNDLGSAAFVRDGLAFKCEIAYRGIIPASALRHLITFPMTAELSAFSHDAVNGELQRYVDLDLLEHFHGKAYDVTADAP